jgi:hypothetical protein
MSMSFNDALQANLGFAQKQTSHIETEVYKTKYPSIDYAGLVPVDYSANEWIKSVTYYSSDAVGKAKWISGNAKDLPTVDLSSQKHETQVYTAGIGYGFGLEEVNQARMLGMNLEADQAVAARRAYEQMVYDVTFLGDTDKGFEGLLDYTGVPAASVAADGTGSATEWSTKTPDQIIRDVNAILIGIHTATKTVELADTLLLPVTSWQAVASTRLTDTGMTILDFIKKYNVYTAQTGQELTIRMHRELETAGAGSTKRMVAYRRSPEVLKLHIPMDHRFLPIQVEGLYFTVPGVFRLGGLDIRLPKAVSYGDAI